MREGAGGFPSLFVYGGQKWMKSRVANQQGRPTCVHWGGGLREPSSFCITLQNSVEGPLYMLVYACIYLCVCLRMRHLSAIACSAEMLQLSKSAS